MNKKGLDEMQIYRKNKIGNQTFIMLLYLMMLDAGLYSFGFRWISYPANNIILLTICGGIYAIRLIASNAYVGPAAEKEKPVFKGALTVFIAVVVAVGIIALFKDVRFGGNNQIEDMAAPILFITAAIAIIITVTTSIIKSIQNKNDLK